MRLNRISMISLLLATPLAFAQTQSQVQSQPQQVQPQSQPQMQVQPQTQAQPQEQTQAQPDTATSPQEVVVLPERVVETTVDLSTGGPQSEQSPSDARKEAISALAEAKATCRRESSGRAAQNECLRQAQDEYKAVMSKTGKQR